MTAATCGWVTMSMRELDRLKVIEAIIEGRLKPAAAAQRLRLTTRQVHRLVLRYREDGPAGLTSRRRGQPSNRQLSPGLENRAISLIRRNYSDFGPTLAQEKLVECHGLKLAKETVRRIMVKASVFRSNHKAPQGGDGYTQFGRAMYELNIESICANRSQAKGRVERANLTLQEPWSRSCGFAESATCPTPMPLQPTLWPATTRVLPSRRALSMTAIARCTVMKIWI